MNILNRKYDSSQKWYGYKEILFIRLKILIYIQFICICFNADTKKFAKLCLGDIVN